MKNSILILSLIFSCFASAQTNHEINKTNSEVESNQIDEIDSITFTTGEVPTLELNLNNATTSSIQLIDIESVTFSEEAVVGEIATLDCAGATINGSLTEGEAATDVSADVSYTGGNTGTHDGQTVTSTGVTGLTATLAAGDFADGAGTLTYDITGTPDAGGTATFALNIGGQTCDLTVDVTPIGEIASLDCAGATITGSLTEGEEATDVSADIDYTGGNTGAHDGQTVTSTGVTGLKATLAAGNFADGAGTLTYDITGTPDAGGTATFALNIGGQTCDLTVDVTPIGEIATLDCAGATINGSLTDGEEASGVSADIDYTGGNTGGHDGQTVTSTGVTGLTATLAAGDFADGAGTLTYDITGTPDGDGTATFALNIGGQTCNLTVDVAAPIYPTGTVHCLAGGADVVEVTTATGKVWMDRNMGASQVAVSTDDADAYGDLYQWGRFSDGHQCRGSGMSYVTSGSDTPGHDNFIVNGAGASDWRTTQNDNLWQGVDGINNPCPNGFRIPTEVEFQDEIDTWAGTTSAAAFDSNLKLTKAGNRKYNDGTLETVGTRGKYWTSTVNGGFAKAIFIDNSNAAFSNERRAQGISVRCIKD